MGVKYEGKLYGRFGGEYVELAMTAEDVDRVVAENLQLRDRLLRVLPYLEHPDVRAIPFAQSTEVQARKIRELLNARAAKGEEGDPK